MATVAYFDRGAIPRCKDYTCGKCESYKGMVCKNPDSDLYGVNTRPDDVCEEFEKGVADMNICPICKQEFLEPPALSRRDNKTGICPVCATKEALEDAGIDYLEGIGSAIIEAVKSGIRTREHDEDWRNGIMAYCTNECKNKECPVNYRNAKKGEIIRDVKAYCGTKICKGYKRP